MSYRLAVGQAVSRKKIAESLVGMQYERQEDDFKRGTFRLRGNIIDIFPSYEELAERIDFFRQQGKAVEAERLEERTLYDLEMLREFGYCPGIENYSLYLSQRRPGEPPYTLLDYFPRDFLTIIDESHVTVPQVGGMYNGDRSRKLTLVEHGFRVPSGPHNRPLNFKEFGARTGQTLYVSATPGEYEIRESRRKVIEQVIRPTGLTDPEVEIRPVKGPVNDLMAEIKQRAEKNERTR